MKNIIYIIKAILRRGPGFVFLYARESLAFDIRHGTNTHLRVPKVYPLVIGSDFQDGVFYVASLTSVIRRTLALTESALGKEAFREAQFIDLGCGKGKTLLVYSMVYGQHARHAPIGIEYDPALCVIARKNARKVIAGLKPIQVQCDSALNIQRYIQSPILVIYLYNPFHGQTLRSVLTAVAKHAHVLIYVDPVEQDMIRELGYEIVASTLGRHNADTWLVAFSRGVREHLVSFGVGAA